MTEEDNHTGLNEETCACCRKKWESNNIIRITETGTYTKWFSTRAWRKAFFVTYRLICKGCNISTTYKKFVFQDDFKPKCENKN